MRVVCSHVTKYFGDEPGSAEAVKDVSFETQEHEFVCIVGPSGCGKTTLLKIIAGLIRTSSGEITYLGENGRGSPLNSMVFQEHGIFPWMSVLDNVAFGLTIRKRPKGEIKARVREADVQIYAIGIYEMASARGRTAEELAGPGLLTEVAEHTGGRQYSVENLNELPDIAAKIGIELRNQYVLGYSSTNQGRDGRYRRVKVRLMQPRGLPPLRAFWRLGYYAPSQ